MAKVHSNDIILTQKEAKELNTKLDKITTITELIELMKETYALADISLELDWNPSFVHYERYNQVIPAFKGRIRGRNVDISGKRRSEVYSISGITEDMSFSQNLFRIDTGSGGGGANWSYDYAYIDIRDFPAMLAKYGARIAETEIKQAQYTHQTDFDKAITALNYKLNRIEDTVKYSTKVQDTKNYIEKLQNTIKQLDSQLNDYTAHEIAKQASADNLVLPTTTSAFVDLTNYNRLTAKLKHNPFAKTKLDKTIHKSQDTYETFTVDYPEFFI